MGQSYFCFPEASRWVHRRGGGRAGRQADSAGGASQGQGPSLVSLRGGPPGRAAHSVYDVEM